MLGLTFKMNKEKKSMSSIGFEYIKVVERVLAHTRCVTENRSSFTSYKYRLICLCYNLVLEMLEEDLLDEIAYEIYSVDGE